MRVSPGAGQSKIVGRHGEVWKVRVSVPAERGRANEALLDVLGEALGLPRRRLSLVAGATGRDKVVEVEGVSLGEAERRLAARQRSAT